MSYNADEAVISGQCYTVVEVNGHPPVALTDFTGDVCMTLLLTGQTRQVVGSGAPSPTSDAIRFHQKDTGPDGKDVRVWTVTLRGDLFLTEPVAAI